MKRILFFLLVLAVITGFSINHVRLQPRADSTPLFMASAHSGAALMPQSAYVLQSAYVPQSAYAINVPKALPPSLRDTDIDGNLRVDADGNLVIDRDLRDVFDYFLSSTGEESLIQIQARLRALLQQLPDPASAQGLSILENYLAFLTALEAMPTPDAFMTDADRAQMSTAAIRERKQAERTLRDQYLDPTVIDAFFGGEDAFDDYMLARMDILGDKRIDSAEKSQRIDALMQQLPSELQEQIQITQRQDVELRLAQSMTDSQSMTAIERQQQREQLLGEEAAVRLLKLDAQWAHWDARIADFLQQRSDLLHNAQLAPEDRVVALDGLRSQLFSSTDLTRVQALERIHDDSH